MVQKKTGVGQGGGAGVGGVKLEGVAGVWAVVLRLAELLPGTPLRELLQMGVDDGTEILAGSEVLGELRRRAIKNHSPGGQVEPLAGGKMRRTLTGGPEVLGGFLKRN